MAKKQLSAGAVIFHRTKGGAEFLLIRNARGHWDFPKGHIEAGETRMEACRREVREETGISRFRIIPGFLVKRTWAFREGGARVAKDCFFFLGSVRRPSLKLSPEHTRGGWFRPVRALDLLEYPGQRSLLRSAIRRANGAGE